MTDIHYGERGEAIHYREPALIMKEAIKSINELHDDADFLLLTGDLAHEGKLGAYEYLMSDLSKLKIPVLFTIGNHDNRKNALAILKGAKADENGFIQQAVELKDNSVLLILDSKKEGTHAGEYCKKRQAWLREQLEYYKNKKVFISIHHAPFNTGLHSMDRLRICKNESLEIQKLLKEHGNVRHIFFGHYHRPLAGNWGGISFSSLRGISHQVKLDFKSSYEICTYEEPQYSIVLIDENLEEGEEPNIMVHYHDFMDIQPFDFSL
mgnify:CR=1 FL=1